MEKDQEIQQKYMQFQQLQQQMQQISENVEILHQQNEDLDISKNALEEIGKTKIDTEILAPIANGIFFKAALKDNQKLILNVGSDTTVEKTIPEAITLLIQQQKEIIERIAEAEKVLRDMDGQTMKIFEDVQQNTEKS